MDTTPKGSSATYYPDKNNQIAVMCPSCGLTRQVEVSLLKKKEIAAKCTCGEKFNFFIEFRKHYRKKVRLAGKYKNATRGETGLVLVEDISKTGMGFTTMDPHKISRDDVLRIDFTLDNVKRTLIQKTVKVLIVRDRFIGVEFLDRGYDNDLGYYLMP